MRRMLPAAVAALLLAAALGAPRAAAQENPLQDPRAKALLELSQRALQQLQAGEHDQAIASYERVLDLVERYDWLPEEVRDELRQIATYNTACAYSLKGERDEALEHLARAFELGFDDMALVGRDPDLNNLRDDERFKRLIAGMKRPGAARERGPYAAEQRRMLASVADEALFPFTFDLETVRGERLRLEDLRGKVVLVDVWGTWCGPCRRAIPHLIELEKRYGPEGLAVVGLNWERGPREQAAAKVRTFLDEHGIGYPCALATRELLESIPDFRGFPTLLLVDREGRVRAKKVGYTPGPVLEVAIEKLLAEEGPEPPPTPAPKPRPGGGAWF